MNPVAIITGASRGIGRGIAVELARAGYDLVLNYVSHDAAAAETAAAAATAAQAAGQTIRSELCRADLAVGPDRERLVQFTRERFGRIDLLVNNAGVAPALRADLLEATEESFDRVLAINLKGPYFLTQQVARWMIEQVGASRTPSSSAPRAGAAPSIIFISSISAEAASSNRGEYCVSKAGISMAVALFADRLAPHGIHVYEIRPGIIRTDMTEPVREKYDALIAQGLTPIRRWGTPGDVARAVAGIAQGFLPFSTGEVIHVDGGLHLKRL